MSLVNIYDYGTLMHMGLPSVTPAEKKTIGKNCNAVTFKVGSITPQDGQN
jgi:hypothetical protein